MDTRLTAVYCRTALADELAIRTQERRIRKYAEKHGYDELTFCRDCGQSGATLDRPAINALTADIRAGKVGVVIAADITRIARNYALYSEWLNLPNNSA
ncbi:MAG: recombinase family protein [Helicobacteraceae bacterium]|jgi:DNA invertase Pin-like site-specific DNA recombinase|nr:recombinase family protein [Helicobacteraceae bacterium]